MRSFRPLFVKITLEMVTPGVIFPTSMLVRAHTGGVKMVSLAYPTTISAFALPSPSGTGRTPF